MFRILTISALFLCIAFSTQAQANWVPPSQAQIDLAKGEILELKTDLLNLYTDDELIRGMYVSLCVFLDNALSDINNGDLDGAIECMEFFKGQVDQAIDTNRISAAEGQNLKGAADYIIDLLNGSWGMTNG